MPSVGKKVNDTEAKAKNIKLIAFISIKGSSKE